MNLVFFWHIMCPLFPVFSYCWTFVYVSQECIHCKGLSLSHARTLKKSNLLPACILSCAWVWILVSYAFKLFLNHLCSRSGSPFPHHHCLSRYKVHPPCSIVEGSTTPHHWLTEVCSIEKGWLNLKEWKNSNTFDLSENVEVWREELSINRCCFQIVMRVSGDIEKLRVQIPDLRLVFCTKFSLSWL